MLRKTLLLLLLVASASQYCLSAPEDEIRETLARAEALYYEADFAKSIELLAKLDESLRSQPGYLREKISVKLQLGLSYIGLNDTAQAGSYFRQLHELDQDYSIDSQQFSPKVIQLAAKAKVEQNEIRCRRVRDDAEQQLGLGNAEAVKQLLGSNQAKCVGLSALAPSTAEIFYKEGLEAYRKARLSDALQKFRSALALNSEHELAAQYVELAETKLQLDADRVLLAWRKDFSAGEFASAAKGYRQLAAVSSADTVTQVRGEYRKALSSLVESWNSACAGNDVNKMNELRQRATELLPEPSFGADLLAQMTTCTSLGCLQMNTNLALARLKTRVDPQFPASVRAQLKVTPITVRVKTKITEKGDVAAAEPQGGNPILHSYIRAAVDRWKFLPAVVSGDARCVDTEIPIVINFSNSDASSR